MNPACPALFGKRSRLVGHDRTASHLPVVRDHAVPRVLVAHDGTHDLLLCRVGCGKLANEGAVVHHADPVTDAEQFRHFRRDHHDAFTGRRQFVDDTIDLVFRTDVDAAGRLVENQDLGVRHQPFRQHDLLLVAAGELADFLIDIRAANVHPGPVLAGGLQFGDFVDHPVRGHPVKACQSDVRAHVVGQDQPELLAVLGHIGKARIDGVRNIREGDFAAIEPNSPADVGAPRPAEQTHREFGAARAHQTGNADDLAAPHVKVHIPDDLPLGMQRVMHRPVLHLQDGISDSGVTRRKPVRKVPIDHAADDPVLLHRLDPAIDLVDGPAIAQHRDAVGDAGDLVQFVGDQDRGDALPAECDEAIEQRRAVGLVEAGGGFVQDQQAHPLGERLGDLDQLLLADTEIGDQRVRLLMQADLGQQFPRTPVHRVAIDDAEPRGRVRKEDVLRDRHQRNQRQLLVNDDDPERLGIVDIAKAPLLAVEGDRPLIAAERIDAAEHFHQRRLAGAVFTDQRVNLAGLDGEIDVTQRRHACKALADAAHLEHGRHRIN